MRGMNSETIDLIYLDPPFNSNANYAAPIGSPAEGVEFKDVWTLQDIDVMWLESIEANRPHLWHVLKGIAGVHSPSMLSYLVYMIPRLEEMRRLLKPTGSIYLHCDPTASQYLKVIMDAIFDKANFRREIVWSNEDSSGFKSKAQNWIRGHDTLLFYCKSAQAYTFNKQYLPLAESTVRRYDKEDENGKYKIYRSKHGEERKVYLSTSKGRGMSSVWADIPSFQTVNNTGEATGYPTQKPLKLLERIISASSNKDDMVLDPFCGCATTCVAAQWLRREWIGIDVSPKAADLVDMRLEKDFNLFKKCIRRTDIPRRTDLGPIPKYNCKENKRDLYGEQQGECNGCEQHFKIHNLTVDHIVAKDVGGSDHISNLQLLCGHCNSVKGKKSQEQLKVRLAELGIL